MHYIRRLGGNGIQSHFGLGAGSRIIFDEHKHFAFMVVVSFYPTEKLILDLLPGILFQGIY